MLLLNKLYFKHFNYIHLSAGELLRIEQYKPDSKFAKQINECLQVGKILPVKITCTLLENVKNQIFYMEIQFKINPILFYMNIFFKTKKKGYEREWQRDIFNRWFS